MKLDVNIAERRQNKMQYNFVLIRTDKGRKYARKILNSIKWLNENKYPQHEFFTVDYTIGQFMQLSEWQLFGDIAKENVIIHPRCANPRTEWTIKLRELQNSGYKVINSVDCIELTSNKLACSLHLQGKVNHPKSFEYQKGKSDLYFEALLDEIENQLPHAEYLIAKPLTSLEQGANVRKINLYEHEDEPLTLKEEFDQVPGNKIVIQEYIPYTALHRVIVIGGKALPYTFIDKPEWHEDDWKVSCCLNRTTMKLNENVPVRLLKLAEDTQKEVGGVINFIDIFEYQDNTFEFPAEPTNIQYTNAEINTACSLNIHEKLAKRANRPDWNIHSRIGRELIKQLGIR